MEVQLLFMKRAKTGKKDDGQGLEIKLLKLGWGSEK